MLFPPSFASREEIGQEFPRIDQSEFNFSRRQFETFNTHRDI